MNQLENVASKPVRPPDLDYNYRLSFSSTDVIEEDERAWSEETQER